MKKLKADLTAVVREDNEVHILKAYFIDDKKLYFQMFNKTKGVITPCFILDADWGISKSGIDLRYTFDKEYLKYIQNCKNVNRYRLIQYYNLFKLQYLSNLFCS